MTVKQHADVHEEATTVADQLTGLEADEVISWLVPFQQQPGRRAALDRFNRVVGELRARGWQLRVYVERAPNGEAYCIEPIASPTTRTAA